jgi:hypothetical protein
MGKGDALVACEDLLSSGCASKRLTPLRSSRLNLNDAFS